MWWWTSVLDALPETNGRYLVASIAHSKPFIANFSTNLSDLDPKRWHTSHPGWWNTDDEAIFEYYYITHWAPLPELPYK